jgi:hypothetical protein
MITIKSATTPVYDTADKKFISLQVDTVEHGIIPMVVNENYDYEYGRILYNNAIAGNYGIIGDYIVPIISQTTLVPASSPQPISTGAQKL